MVECYSLAKFQWSEVVPRKHRRTPTGHGPRSVENEKRDDAAARPSTRAAAGVHRGVERRKRYTPSNPYIHANTKP
eukprot:2095874-Prymnesium_polylepis.1